MDGMVPDFSRYIKPLDEVLTAVADQQKLLERYQAKYGELAEEVEEVSEVEELE